MSPSERVYARGGLLDWVESTITEGSTLADLMIQILLYANDIVLLMSSTKGLQRHLETLEVFYRERDLTSNLGK